MVLTGERYIHQWDQIGEPRNRLTEILTDF